MNYQYDNYSNINNNYQGLVFEDHSKERKEKLAQMREENFKIMQMKKNMQIKQKEIKETETQEIKNSYNEYIKLSNIDKENNYINKKKLSEFNLYQDNLRKSSNYKQSIDNRQNQDHFVDDINKKKEIQYTNKLIRNNENIFKHMKDYENYINSRSPGNKKSSYIDLDIKKQSSYPETTLNNNDHSQYNNRYISHKNSYETLKAVDDLYNKKIADEIFQEKNYLKNSISHKIYNPILSTSNNERLIGNGYNPMSNYTNNNNSLRNVKYSCGQYENSFIAKMIVKINNLGVKGAINLYHQLFQKDKFGNRSIDFYDFRGIIISIYKIDFTIDDCKGFLQVRGSNINQFPISIPEFLYRITNFNEERKGIVDIIFKKIDKDNDQLIQFNEELKYFLNTKPNKDKSMEVINFISFVDEFFIMGYGYQSINRNDFFIFFSCISVAFENDKEYINYLKSIFEIEE